MSRAQDVRVIGVIVAQLTEATPTDAATYSVEVEDQVGEHITGATAPVSARTVAARCTLRMRDAGFTPEPGDRVALLVNHWIAAQKAIATIVYVERRSTAAKRTGTHGGYGR